MGNNLLLDEQLNVHSFPDEDVNLALSQGFRLPTPEEQLKIKQIVEGNLAEQAKRESIRQAGEADLIPGLGLSAGDVAATTGKVANAMTFGAFETGLEKFAPETAETLKIVQEQNPTATTVGEVAGFGASLAAPIGQVGNLVKAKTGSRMLAGAAEGAVIATPTVLVDVANGDYTEAAENVAFSSGVGAVLGGLITLGEKGATLVKDTAKKGLPNLEKWSREVSENQTLKQAGFIKSTRQKLVKSRGASEEDFQNVAQYYKDSGIVNWISKSPQEAENILERDVDLMRADWDSFSNAVDKVNDQYVRASGNSLIRPNSIIRNLRNLNLEEFADKLGNELPMMDAQRKAFSQVINTVDLINQIPKQDLNFSYLMDLKLKVKQAAYQLGGDPKLSNLAKTVAKVERAIDSEMGVAVSKAEKYGLSEAFKNWLNLKERTRVFDLASFGLKNLDQSEFNRLISPGTWGSSMIGGQLGGGTGVVAAGALNQLRNRYGAGILSKTMDGIADISQASQTRYKGAITKLIQGGVSRAEKAARVANIGSFDYFNSSDIEAIQDGANQAMSNPELLTEILSNTYGGLSDENPALATQAHQKTIEAIQYLQQTSPEPSSVDNPFEKQEKKFNSQDVDRFNKRLKATLDPLHVFEDAVNGDLDPSSIETVKTLYPKLYSDAIAALMDEVTNNPRDFTYKQKYNISLLLGKEVSGVLAPDKIKSLQDTFKQQPQGGDSLPKASSSKQADYLKTPLQETLDR